MKIKYPQNMEDSEEKSNSIYYTYKYINFVQQQDK